MIFSDSPAFIFIAVPKTGTSSIESALRSCADARHSTAYNKHVLAMKLKAELPGPDWARSWKFAFVREPCAWMYSWYRYRQRDALKSVDHPFHKRYTGDISFDRFVHTFQSGELMLKQSDFIATHAGELLVDFVGHYEQLQQDFDRVCDYLGIANQILPAVNASAPAAFSDDLLSAGGREIINNYFSQDFELFGYEKR